MMDNAKLLGKGTGINLKISRRTPCSQGAHSINSPFHLLPYPSELKFKFPILKEGLQSFRKAFHAGLLIPQNTVR